MAQLPPKKGPRMTHIEYKAAMSHEEAERLEFEAELDANADKVFNIAEKARSRMTASERVLADKKADAILKNATENAGLSRRRA
jgi:hypothetical protein